MNSRQRRKIRRKVDAHLKKNLEALKPFAAEIKQAIDTGSIPV